MDDDVVSKLLLKLYFNVAHLNQACYKNVNSVYICNKYERACFRGVWSVLGHRVMIYFLLKPIDGSILLYRQD